METRKLYYEDPFQKGFATTVVSCDAVKGSRRRPSTQRAAASRMTPAFWAR